jgi:DnaJ-class molecular chaperone
VNIEKGMKNNEQIIFPEMSDEYPGKKTNDLIFKIEQIPHRSFQRKEDDLYVNEKIDLIESLTGFDLEIETIDKRILEIRIDQIIEPESHYITKNEGMPNKKSGKRGNLIIIFSIKFPKEISNQQREKLKEILK